MKRRQFLACGRRTRQQTLQRDLKDPSRTVQARYRERGPEREAFGVDPDHACSSGPRPWSVKTDRAAEESQMSTSLQSGTADLSGINECVCETKPLENEDSAPSSPEVILLSDSGEDEILQWEWAETSRTSVAPALAERTGDIWEACRPNEDIPGWKRMCDDPLRFPTESCAGVDSLLDHSLSEDTVTSGPSSPYNDIISRRCKECKILFSRMRRRAPPKLTKKSHDPASLSCDNWFLNKGWHPRRRRQVKGRLWVHLKRIRKLAAERSDGAGEVAGQNLCSRLHVFLRRNLRRCRERSVLSSVCEGRRTSRPCQRHVAKSTWPPLGNRSRHQSHKTSQGRSSRGQHLSSPDVGVGGRAVEHSAPPARLRRQAKALETRRADCYEAGSVQGEQVDGDAPEGACRVLKFDNVTPGIVTMETQKPRQELVQEKSAGGKLCDSPADLALKDQDVHRDLQKGILEDSNGFRTPLEVSSIGSKVVRKSRLAYVPHNSSFRLMLASLEKSHNRIIKETDT